MARTMVSAVLATARLRTDGSRTTTTLTACASARSPFRSRERLPGEDDVELLLSTAGLVVVADQQVTRVARDVRVRPERSEPEVVLDRVPLRRAPLVITDTRNLGETLDPVSGRHGADRTDCGVGAGRLGHASSARAGAGHGQGLAPGMTATAGHEAGTATLDT